MSENDELRTLAQKLHLFGLLARWDEYGDAPWLANLLKVEEAERRKRGIELRLKNAKLGKYKPLSDFDWKWPSKVDRASFDDLLNYEFVEAGSNVVLLGPNGVGKTTLLKNLAYHAVMRGFSARFITATDMLNELALQESTAALNRRLKSYVSTQLLCIDEVGYLSYDNRYTDLFYEVVTRRYEAEKPIALTTNKAFSEWTDVFPHAACVVTMVDRLVHRCEIIAIQGKSYRMKEAQERTARKQKSRPKGQR